MSSWFCWTAHRELFFASPSAFQPLFVGLGFRVIPALGSVARQFQPCRVSVSPADCRLRLLNGTNSLPWTLRKTVSLAWRAAPFAPGRPNESGHERKTKHALQESHHSYWFSRPTC